MWDATSKVKVAAVLTHKDGGGQWHSQTSIQTCEQLCTEVAA